MLKILKRYQKSIMDLVYSFVAYALPTAALQFIVQPMIAARIGAEANGLFLTLFSVVKLCVTVLVAPLTSLRLLDKKVCQEHPEYDRSFNWLFGVVAAVSLVVTVLSGVVYRAGDFWGLLRLALVLVLLAAHDFYAIAFRVTINYRRIVIDNALIVAGYGIGLLLMRWLPYWEVVFICGYVIGLAFVLLSTRFWRAGRQAEGVGRILPRYGQLCASSGLGSVTVYCDKLMIYPMLGGYAVSVYNVAALVSKIISVATVPLRNVMLSYLVDKDKLVIPAKVLRRAMLVVPLGFGAAYACCYAASWVLGRLLYPQLFQEALRFVPVTLLAVLVGTLSSVMNVFVYRFSSAKLQIILSLVKINVYLASIVVLCGVFDLGLWGFCFSLLLSALARLALETYYFIKIMTLDTTA